MGAGTAITIGALVVQHIPEEAAALEAVARLAGQIIQAIEHRRSTGNVPPEMSEALKAQTADVMTKAHALLKPTA